MESLKWGIVGVLSLAGGYLGYKLTGGWVGVPVGAVVVAYTCAKLLVGEFVSAGMAVCGGAFALFYFMVTDAPQISKDNLPTSGEGFTKPAIEFVSPSATPASDVAVAAAPPVSGALPAGMQPVSALPELTSGTAFRDCADCPEMVVLPGGTFTMGSGSVPTGKEVPAAEMHAHTVVVRGIAIGQDAVTRGQFSAFVTAANYQSDAERLGGCFALAGDKWEFRARQNWRRPGFPQTDNHPAVCVSWNDATAYANWLSTVTRQKYRLPTEAEREYATRASTQGDYWWGEGVRGDQANFLGSNASHKGTVLTRQFAANPFGLFNVHGNVWEWVQDCQHDNYTAAPADGSAWAVNCSSTRRGVRGGGWTSPPAGLRAAHRTWFEPDLPSYAGGFRVVRELAK